MTIGTRRCWVVSLTHRPPLPSGLSWYSFLEAESTPGTWNYRTPRKKSPATPEIDPGTFRLVAQCLNHYATPCPGILVQFIYITRLASNEIFSPSNKIHREVGRAKDLSARLYITSRSQRSPRSHFVSVLEVCRILHKLHVIG